MRTMNASAAMRGSVTRMPALDGITLRIAGEPATSETILTAIAPQEIAGEWGITPQALADRIARGTLPPPVKVAGRVRLYLRGDLERYRDAASPAGAATAATLKARREAG